MKKTLGGIAALVVILLMSAPWIIGRQVEAFYSQITDETFQHSPTIELTDKSYKKGLFTSTVTGGINLKSMGQKLELPFALRYKSVITHGPVFWSAFSSASPVGMASDHTTVWVEPTGEEDAELTALIKELPSFEMDSVIGFTKSIDSVFQIAPYTKTITGEKTPVAIAFAGLTGSGALNWKSRDFDVTVAMPSFTVNEDDTEHLTINSARFSADKKGGDTSARYNFDRIAITSTESNLRFALDAPYMVARGQETEVIYNSALEVGFKSLAANELAYAPARLHITMENLDKPSIDALRETLNEASATNDEMESDMYGIVVMGKIMELLPEILKQNPKITLAELNIGTGKDEALTATGYAAILGEKAAELPSVTLIAQAMDARFEAALPKAFLNTFVDLGKLIKYMDKGFLVSDGRYYRINADIKEGHVTINGNTIM